MKKILICALLISNSAFPQYCTPGSTSQSTYSIGQILTTGNINIANTYISASVANPYPNNSTYQDLRYTTNPINPVLVVSNGNSNTLHLIGLNFDIKYCTIWIDLNGDGTFGPNEVVIPTTSTGIQDTSNHTINYPFNFTPSVSRNNYAMRILMSKSNQTITDSCTLPISQYNKVIDVSVGYTNPLLANNQYQKLEMSVYPNPTSDVVNFSIENDINYKLYDTESRLIQSGYGKSINIVGLNSGIYILETFDDNRGVGIAKIIKK